MYYFGPKGHHDLLFFNGKLFGYGKDYPVAFVESCNGNAYPGISGGGFNYGTAGF